MTVETNRNWAEIFAFGTSNGGENSSSGGSASPYIALIPDTGDGANTLRLTSHDAAGAELGASAAAGAVLSPAVEHHLVGVFDQSAGTPGSLTLYLDGAFVSSNSIAPGLDLNTFTNNNNWLGRSMWPDPIFDGMINEVGIFDNALTQGEVTSLFQAGPLAIPEPTSILLLLSGLGAICRRR